MAEERRRLKRVEKEVWEVISTYLTREQSGSRDALVSLTQVSVSGDLRKVKAYVCMIGADEVDGETLGVLSTHAPEIQKKIGDRLRMKYCPRVEFYNDPSVRLMASLSPSREGP